MEVFDVFWWLIFFHLSIELYTALSSGSQCSNAIIMTGNSRQSDGEADRKCVGSKFLFSCKKNSLSSVWLGSDGRKHTSTVIEELKSTCCGDVEQGPYKSSAPWGGGVREWGGGGFSVFVCSAAKQTRTLVNGQHQVCLMERLRNHARTNMHATQLTHFNYNEPQGSI